MAAAGQMIDSQDWCIDPCSRFLYNLGRLCWRIEVGLPGKFGDLLLKNIVDGALYAHDNVDNYG